MEMFASKNSKKMHDDSHFKIIFGATICNCVNNFKFCTRHTKFLMKRMLKLVLDKFVMEDLGHLKSEGVATWDKTWGSLGHVIRFRYIWYTIYSWILLMTMQTNANVLCCILLSD